MVKAKKLSANARAIGCGTQAIMYIIIVLVVLFSDVMFISMLWNAFPGGFMRILAAGGAFATGLSVIALVIGKSHWFRPGPQLVFAWFFTGAEVVVSIINVVTAIQVAEGHALGWLSYWLLIAPATPFLAVIGWIIIAYLDSARKELHDHMEMEDEKREAELEYVKAEHEAHMTVKTEFLQQYQSFLLEEARSPVNLAQLREGAHRMSQNVISGIIGSPIAMHGTNYIAQNAQSRSDAPTPKEVTGTLNAVSPAPTADAEDKSESIISKIKNAVTGGGSKDENPLAAASLSHEATVLEPPKTNGNSHQ